MNVGSIYLDEDPSQSLALDLDELGHDAIATSPIGNKTRTDPWQLAFAARERRVLVTCNVRDFSMLHEAWISWSDEWGVGARVAHAGILLIPQEPEATRRQVAGAIDELLRREPSLDHRLLRWRPKTGWVEL